MVEVFGKCVRNENCFAEFLNIVLRRGSCSWDKGQLHIVIRPEYPDTFYGCRNLHDYRYDVRAHTERGLRNRVIYVRKSLSKDFTLD